MGESRGLITDTERRRIAGEEEVEDQKRYQAVSRVRQRIERLADDIEFLEQHHPDLADEIRENVTTTGRPAKEHVHDLIAQWQDRTPSSLPPRAEVLLLSHGDPGEVIVELEASEDVHPAEFYLRVADHLESCLDETDQYPGTVNATAKSVVFLEDVAKRMWVDFDGLSNDNHE